MYTNTYLAEHNAAMYVADSRRDAAHRRLLTTLSRQQRENEPGRDSSRTGIVRRLARFVLRPVMARSIAQA